MFTAGTLRSVLRKRTRAQTSTPNASLTGVYRAELLSRANRPVKAVEMVGPRILLCRRRMQMANAEDPGTGSHYGSGGQALLEIDEGPCRLLPGCSKIYAEKKVIGTRLQSLLGASVMRRRQMRN